MSDEACFRKEVGFFVGDILVEGRVQRFRKLPGQVHSSKVEFPAVSKRASISVRSSNESCGLSSLYSSAGY